MRYREFTDAFKMAQEHVRELRSNGAMSGHADTATLLLMANQIVCANRIYDELGRGLRAVEIAARDS